MTSKPTVISLFSGAGGLDYGFEAAGYRTAVALELDRDCCTTLRENRKRWPVIEDDVHRVTSKDLLGRAELRAKEADIVIGGPPCQPFSKSGYWAKGDSARLDDPRAKTLEEFFRVVRDVQPRVFLLENVQGIKYRNKSEGYDFLLRQIEQINKETGARYSPTWAMLKAVEFGVPQRRERFFMVAARDGTPFRFPEPTHAEVEDLALPGFSDRLPAHTAWDALGDERPAPDEELAPRGEYAELLSSIPEGHNYLYHTDRGGGEPLFGWRRRYWSFLLKLAKDQPSWTIQAQPGPAIGPFHWDNRRLSMREMCRLQTFPEDVKILGGRGAVQRQVGNAVPSLLAEILGREIRTQLLRRPPVRKALERMPIRRESMPPAVPPGPVHEKYKKLIKEPKSAHPGTGKGFAASRRMKPLESDAAQVELELQSLAGE